MGEGGAAGEQKAKDKGVTLLLRSDVVVADKFAPDANNKIVPAIAIPDGWMGLDIGPDSIETFNEALYTTKTVIWNGPMGVFEMEKFVTGTEVAELALLEESFETNVRDYTKIIHAYVKQNQVQKAENTLLGMKRRGFMSDQVTLTALIHMYSKLGNLKMAEELFEEMKLLGVPLDRRSYGSIIMAYVRAGMFDKGEDLLQEMDDQQNYAGKEVYKALLRGYSMIGDCAGAQRIFDATQLAGITPDVKLCALLINVHVVAGQSCEAYIGFENMRKAGLRPNDKCVALILTAYQKENKLKKALEFLIELERNGILLEKEASTILAGWFRSLGVVEEVTLLRDYELCKA